MWSSLPRRDRADGSRWLGAAVNNTCCQKMQRRFELARVSPKAPSTYIAGAWSTSHTMLCTARAARVLRPWWHPGKRREEKNNARTHAHAHATHAIHNGNATGNARRLAARCSGFSSRRRVVRLIAETRRSEPLVFFPRADETTLGSVAVPVPDRYRRQLSRVSPIGLPIRGVTSRRTRLTSITVCMRVPRA